MMVRFRARRGFCAKPLISSHEKLAMCQNQKNRRMYDLPWYVLPMAGSSHQDKWISDPVLALQNGEDRQGLWNSIARSMKMDDGFQSKIWTLQSSLT